MMSNLPDFTNYVCSGDFLFGSAFKVDCSTTVTPEFKEEIEDDLISLVSMPDEWSGDFMIDSDIKTECSIKIEPVFKEEKEDDLISIVSMLDEEFTGNNDTATDVIKYEDLIQIHNEPRNSRKRKKNENLWKQNIAKIKRQKGQEYVSTFNKKTVAAKSVKDKTCNSVKCPLKCSSIISDSDRQTINSGFWGLNNDRKNDFYAKYVTKSNTERKRSKLGIRNRLNSYKYYLEIRGEIHQVCQPFFLNTLHISSRTIYYFFEKVVDGNIGLARYPLSGKHVKRHISDVQFEEVKSHIKSFPLMPAHYCRCDSKRLYLSNDIQSVQQMYNYHVGGSKSPVKIHTYRKIFVTEFNISFYIPKKDICNKCDGFKNKLSLSLEEIEKHNRHVDQKEKAKAEKKKDLKETQNDPTTAVLSFDLENVFNFPMGNTSLIFYKRKWRSFNLTGKSNKTSSVYNALWHEGMMGRGGEDIASALIKNLVAFLEEQPKVKKLILWSDSCVAQNRNCFMSSALLNFLHQPESRKLETIIQKYCEAGHSCVTEVDCAHSLVSRRIKNHPIGSHPSLITLFNGFPKSKKNYNFLVLDMRPDDFKDFRSYAETFNFKGNIILINDGKQHKNRKQIFFFIWFSPYIII